VKGDYLKKNEGLVKNLVEAVREGWTRYQKDPLATNKFMSTLNKAMDLQTFNESAGAQRSLVQKDPKTKLGNMTESRWSDSAKQLVEFKVVPQLIDVKEAFKNY
jgi:ABC-type nitrate/sulfonate/bicarbonate transport system substrate-binding protein